MTDPRLDVLCIGNAIVDVIADATDEFLEAQGLKKGSMNLIDAERAEELYGLMNPGREISGGSAGNTAAGIAALGGKAGFIGQVNADQLGQIYKHDIEAAGVEFLAAPRDALVLRANRISVYVIDQENNAKRHDVELGTAEGDYIEVIGDIEPGDSVVIRGGERLRDGQSVTISEIQRPQAGKFETRTHMER